jgi:large subunit ribosomal protein L22
MAEMDYGYRKEKRRKNKAERSLRKQRQEVRNEQGSLSEVQARLKSLRVSPRKARLVANLIRNLPVEQARQQLEFSARGVAKPMLKLLNSAVANARQEGLNEDALMVHRIWVDAGPTLHRFMPRAMGRVSPVNKRTSHITIIVKEEEEE